MKCTRTNLCVINLSGSMQLKNGSMILEQVAAWLGKEGVALPVGAGPSPAAGGLLRAIFLCSALHNLIHSEDFEIIELKKTH